MKRIPLAWCTPVLLLAAFGCTSNTPEAAGNTATPATEGTTVSNTTTTKEGEKMDSSTTQESTQGGETAAPGATMPKEGDEVAVMKTNQGTIVLKFFPEKAPKHVEAFKTLAKKGFYDGIKFHRVIEGFMIQGGDPNTKDESKKAMWGTGGPGYTLKQEFNDIKHTPGILSAARTQDPDSAGSQFFLMHKTSPHLDNQYTVYGQVVKGMDIVEKIATTKTDPSDRPLSPMVIESVKIEKWPVK